MGKMIEKVIQDAIKTIDSIENVSLKEKLSLVVASLVMERYLEKIKEDYNESTNAASRQCVSLCDHVHDHIDV